MLRNPRSRTRRGVLAICATLLAASIPHIAAAQTASILGIVLRDSTETPIANADVTLLNSKKSVRTDNDGRFAFRDLKAGRHSINVRIVGYEAIGADINLKDGERVEPEFILRPKVTSLTPVDVKATGTTGPWAIRLKDFDDRRALGMGRFLTADFFEKKGGAPASSFLAQEIPGLKFVANNGHRWMASLRGGFTDTREAQSRTREYIPEACYMQILVNGIVRYNAGLGQSMFDVDELNSKDIIGFEFYTPASTPLQYLNGRSSACGTILIWTKAG